MENPQDYGQKTDSEEDFKKIDPDYKEFVDSLNRSLENVKAF